MQNWRLSVYATDYSRFIEKVIRETNEELLSYETFTRILVKVDNPLIVLTPRPGYPYFITVDLGIISVANRHQRSRDRHASEEAWVDVYNVSCQEMSITTQTNRITSYFDLNLEIDRLISTERQSLISGFDESYGIRGVCKEILFDISQFEYMLLLKLFDMNILYDDHMEKFVSSDNLSAEGNRGNRVPFMRMDFQFERISVLIKQEIDPIAELIIYGNNISMVRFVDDFVTFDLTSKTFQLYSAVSSEHSEVFPALATEPGRLKTIVGRPINDQIQVLKTVFEVHLEKTWDSNKRIHVQLHRIGLYMNLAVLLELQNFFYYGIPEYRRERETPLDYLTKYRPSPEDIEGEAQDQWFAPKIEFSLEITRPIIVFPTSPGARILVSEGDVYFEYYREHERVLADNPNAYLESRRKDFRWKDLELFSIRSKALAGISDISSVTKRKIISPFTYEYKSILENKGRKAEKYYLTHGTSPVHLILSFNDLTHFRQSYLYQKSALDERWDVIKLLELIQSPKHLDFQSVSEYPSLYTKNELVRQSLQLQRYRTSGVVESTLNLSQKESFFEEHLAVSPTVSDCVVSEVFYNLPELRVIMINDCAGAYSPLLNAKCSLTRGISQKGEKNEEIRIECDTRVKYYNPLADRWEPLVECLRATFLYRCNQDATPRTQFIVSVSDEIPLNINLSEAMLMHLYKVVNIWQTINTDSNKELVELVSPFSIRNDFGSLIIIETAGQQSRIQVIDPGITAPYEVEISGRRDFTNNDESITLRLMMDEEEIERLTGISMRKVQCLTRTFSYNETMYKLVLDITLVETRKVLTVRSQMLFVNETGENVFLYFPYRPRNILGECPAGKSCPVPFLYCESIIGILSSHSDSSEPTPVDLRVLLSSETGHCMELSTYQFNLVLYVHRHKENRDKVTVRILPPFRFRNLLPCAVLTTFSSQQARIETVKAKVAKGETYDLHSFTTSQEMHLTLRMKDLNESESVIVAAKKVKLRAKAVTLRDVEGNELMLTLSYREEGCREISVYAAVSILNYTSLPLSFYYRKRGGSRKVPIQDPGEAILCSPCTKLATELNLLRSESFKIGAVGAHNVVAVKGEKDQYGDFTLYQFVYDVEVAWPKADELLYTRVVSISPRLIIVNLLKCYLVVIQESVHKDPLILQPGDRSPFYWTTGRHKELVQIRPVPTSVHYKNISKETDMHWDWSGPIAITNMGTTIVQCKDKVNLGKYALVKAEVRLVEFSALAIFEEEEERFSSYRVENKSEAVSLAIYQVDCEEHKRYVDIMASTNFGWTNPLNPHQIVVEFYIGALASWPIRHCKYLFNFEQLNKPQFAKIKRTAELGHVLFLLVHNVGSTIVLEVSDSPLESLDSSDDQALSVINVNIPHMGFSVIESKWPSVKELIYAHVTGIDCYFVTTEKLKSLVLTVQTAQVDNQYNSAPIYPVVVFQNRDGGGSDVLKATISQYIDESRTVKSFKEVAVTLQSLSLNVESILVRKLVGLYLRAMKELASAQPEGVHVIFQPFTSDKLKSPVWLTQELSRSHIKYYIEKLNLHPVKLILSYATLNEEQEQTADDELLAILNARGMLVMNVDSVPLCFYNFEVENVNANQKQIFQALGLHYKSQFKSELFKLIGYTDILGNPIGLFNNLGTGFIDLLYEPVQGMTQGPLEAGKGFVKGAGSFLKNSVSATFGTVSKLAGSVATGITALTQDKDAMLQRQRDKAAHNPKDVVEGIAYGVKSLALGFGRGVVGIISEPYKGAKNEGFAGLIKGGLRGVSGLIVRPVAGVFDFTSKTAEGIKNTTHRFESKQGFQRIRPPRVTYGLSHHIRPYNENDAEVVQFMNDLNSKKYRHLTFYSQVITQDWEGGQVLIVLYQELFVAVYILTRKVIWETERELMESVCESDVRCGVIITRKCEGKKSNSRLQFLATFSNPTQQTKVLKKLRKVYFSSLG